MDREQQLALSPQHSAAAFLWLLSLIMEPKRKAKAGYPCKILNKGALEPLQNLSISLSETMLKPKSLLGLSPLQVSPSLPLTFL